MKFNNLVDVILEVDSFLNSAEMPEGLSDHEKKIFITALSALEDFKSYPERYRGEVREAIIKEAAARIYNYRNG